MIEDLRHWNEDLRRALEKPEMPAEDDSPKVQALKRRFNGQRCNSIRACFRSTEHSSLNSVVLARRLTKLRSISTGWPMRMIQ